MPKLSIIIPVYNVEKYIDCCLKSVINQTIKDIEIILVDDGSKDNSSIICDKYSLMDNRIKVIHKVNQGLGYARNSGIEIATGEYVTFLDSDDFVDLVTYERICKLISKYSLDALYFKYERFSNEDEVGITKINDEIQIYSGENVNNLMLDGKKSVAFKVFYDAMEIVEQRKEDPEKPAVDVWKDALTNVMPHVEVRSRRVGGATFQIPMQIRPDRKISMAMKWLIKYCRARNEKSMAQKLAGEVLAAAKEEGAAYKKRMDTHKMAEANKAFSHFRF